MFCFNYMDFNISLAIVMYPHTPTHSFPVLSFLDLLFRSLLNLVLMEKCLWLLWSINLLQRCVYFFWTWGLFCAPKANIQYEHLFLPFIKLSCIFNYFNFTLKPWRRTEQYQGYMSQLLLVHMDDHSATFLETFLLLAVHVTPRVPVSHCKLFVRLACPYSLRLNHLLPVQVFEPQGWQSFFLCKSLCIPTLQAICVAIRLQNADYFFPQMYEGEKISINQTKFVAIFCIIIQQCPFSRKLMSCSDKSDVLCAKAEFDCCLTSPFLFIQVFWFFFLLFLYFTFGKIFYVGFLKFHNFQKSAFKLTAWDRSKVCVKFQFGLCLGFY